jgi:hypothetical protein
MKTIEIKVLKLKSKPLNYFIQCQSPCTSHLHPRIHVIHSPSLDTSAVMEPQRENQQKTVKVFNEEFHKVLGEIKEENQKTRLKHEHESSSGFLSFMQGTADQTFVWPTDHSGLRYSIAKFASTLENGAEQHVGLTSVVEAEDAETNSAKSRRLEGGSGGSTLNKQKTTIFNRQKTTKGASQNQKQETTRVLAEIDHSVVDDFFEKLEYEKSDAALLPAIDMCGLVI